MLDSAAGSGERVVRTVCSLCYSCCGVLIHVKDGEVVRIEGDPDHPNSKGALCPKGLSGIELLYHPDRLDFHVYRHWAPIVNRRTWTESGGPWRWAQRDIQYSPDACPRTLDLLGRAIHLDVNPLLTNAEVEETVAAVNKVLNALS